MEQIPALVPVFPLCARLAQWPVCVCGRSPLCVLARDSGRKRKRQAASAVAPPPGGENSTMNTSTPAPTASHPCPLLKKRAALSVLCVESGEVEGRGREGERERRGGRDSMLDSCEGVTCSHASVLHVQPSALADVEREHLLNGLAEIRLNDLLRWPLQPKRPLFKPNHLIKVFEQV